MPARARPAAGALAPRARKPPRSLKAHAIGYLARRDYARGELRQKLLGLQGAEALERSAVDAVLDELDALGYLSDERYARALVTRKAGSYSRRAIAEELKFKGVAAETIAQALATAEADDDAALIALWQRRFGQAPRDEREKARQVRFLQRRGFALAAIFKLLRDPPESP